MSTEDDIVAWLSTGQRPRSSSRPKSSRRGRDERPRKKILQECWVEPPGPMAAVLDMHAEAVERLHQVTYTSGKLQEQYDSLRSQLDTASRQTQFEEAIIAGLENCELALALALPKIEDRIVQLMRASLDSDDIEAVHELHGAVEEQLKQAMQDLQERTAKERKLAQRLPDVLKANDELKEILDDTISQREALKLDKQMLEEKVRMVTTRAETAEQGRDKALERAAALDEKMEAARIENHDQRKQILKLQAENKDVNQVRAELKRVQRSLGDANKFLDDAVREKGTFEVEVEKLSAQLDESNRELRELQLHVYQEDLKTRDMRDRFAKMVDQLESERENRQLDAEMFKEKEKELRELIEALDTQLKKEMEWHSWIEASMSEVEEVNDQLSRLVPDVLQSRKEENARELNRIQDLEIRKSILEEKVRALNTELKEAEEAVAAAEEALGELRSKSTGKNEQLNDYLQGALRTGRMLEKFPNEFKKLETTVQHAVQFVSIMKVDNDGAMAQVRATLQELQEQETALQQANQELTTKLSRAEVQGANFAKQKTQAVSERDSAKKMVWKAEQDAKTREKLLNDTAEVLGPLDTLSQQLLGAIEFLAATILRQRTLSATEIEKEAEDKIAKVRGELAEAQEGNAELLARNQELTEQQKQLRQEILGLQAIVADNTAAISASAAVQMEKEELMQSLARACRDTLQAAEDLSQCAALTSDNLQAEIHERDTKIERMDRKKRKNAPGKRKSKSPDKASSSWASFSVRTHERAIGSKRRSVSPGGSHLKHSRAVSAHPEAQRQRDLHRSRAASAVLSTRIQNGKAEEVASVSAGVKGGRQASGGRIRPLREHSRGAGADASDNDLDIGQDDDPGVDTWIGDSIMGSTTSSKHPASHVHSLSGRQSPSGERVHSTMRIASARPSRLRPATAVVGNPRPSTSSAGRFGLGRWDGSDDPWGRPKTVEDGRKGGDARLSPRMKRALSSSKLLESVMQARKEKDVVLVRCQMVSPAHRPATAITRANKGMVNAPAATRSNKVRTQSAAHQHKLRDKLSPRNASEGRWRLGDAADVFDEHRLQFEQQLRGVLNLSGPPTALAAALATSTVRTEVGDRIEGMSAETDHSLWGEEIRTTATAMSSGADILILSPTVSEQGVIDVMLPGLSHSIAEDNASLTPPPLSPLSSCHSSKSETGEGRQEAMADESGKRDGDDPRSKAPFADGSVDLTNDEFGERRSHIAPTVEQDSRHEPRPMTSEGIASMKQVRIVAPRPQTAPSVPSLLPDAPPRCARVPVVVSRGCLSDSLCVCVSACLPLVGSNACSRAPSLMPVFPLLPCPILPPPVHTRRPPSPPAPHMMPTFLLHTARGEHAALAPLFPFSCRC